MSWPTVTIGIPTWNRLRMVLRAIDSVKRQDYPGEIEIVVADDGSADGTVGYLTRRGGCVVLPGPHKGIAATKNRALLGGSGEIRGILDSDDYYEPQFVRRCVENLLSHQGVGLAYTDNYDVNWQGNRSPVVKALNWSLSELLDTCNLRGDCWLAWWSVLRETDLHDERMMLEVDYDLFYKLAKVTEFMRVPEALHNVTQHRTRSTRDRTTAAFWHAACLAKHGFPIEYAIRRASRMSGGHMWAKAIQDGYRHGLALHEATVEATT